MPKRRVSRTDWVTAAASGRGGDQRGLQEWSRRLLGSVSTGIPGFPNILIGPLCVYKRPILVR